MGRGRQKIQRGCAEIRAIADMSAAVVASVVSDRTELLHSGLQRCALHPQPDCGTPRPCQHPVARFQGFEDVLTLSGLKGDSLAGHWFGWELQIAEWDPKDWTGRYNHCALDEV